MFQIKVVEKIKIHILNSVTFCSENLSIYDVEECGGSREAV